MQDGFKKWKKSQRKAAKVRIPSRSECEALNSTPVITLIRPSQKHEKDGAESPAAYGPPDPSQKAALRNKFLQLIQSYIGGCGGHAKCARPCGVYRYTGGARRLSWAGPITVPWLPGPQHVRTAALSLPVAFIWPVVPVLTCPIQAPPTRGASTSLAAPAPAKAAANPGASSMRSRCSSTAAAWYGASCGACASFSASGSARATSRTRCGSAAET